MPGFDLPALFGLAGRTALVTGAGRGIGAAIARALAGAGAHVFVHDRTEAQSETTLAHIVKAGGTGARLAGDLGRREVARRLIEDCEAQAGHLDILVINASAQINGQIADCAMADFDTQIDINLRATLGMLQACLPRMAARGWGRVINIGSINQYAPKEVVTIYAATKAAQHNIVQSQARAFAKTGVVLNTLAPGLIDTERAAERKAADPEGWAAYCAEVNWMGRAGLPHEMAGAAVFLASDACAFMTGQTMNLTGGM